MRCTKTRSPPPLVTRSFRTAAVTVAPAGTCPGPLPMMSSKRIKAWLCWKSLSRSTEISESVGFGCGTGVSGFFFGAAVSEPGFGKASAGISPPLISTSFAPVYPSTPCWNLASFAMTRGHAISKTVKKTVPHRNDRVDMVRNPFSASWSTTFRAQSMAGYKIRELDSPCIKVQWSQ